MHGNILNMFDYWPDPVVNFLLPKKNSMGLGSGCGSVGRAVTSKTGGPRFESSHCQNFKMKI